MVYKSNFFGKQKGFDTGEIEKYLRILNDMLSYYNIKIDIVIAGGAAMVLEHAAKRRTRDIDAIYSERDIVSACVSDIADEFGLPIDWLNDRVRDAFDNYKKQDIDSHIYFKLSNVAVSCVNMELLLAMKLYAYRLGTDDEEDIKILLKGNENLKFGDVKNIVNMYYDWDDDLSKIAKRFLERWFKE